MIKGFTSAELLWHYERAVESNLDTLWFAFSCFSDEQNPSFLTRYDSFAARRDRFFDLVAAFVELEYIRLYWQFKPDTPWVEGAVDEQLALLRKVFPENDDGMEVQGVTWFYVECPFEVVWNWAGRKPTPLFPNHNTQYSYIESTHDWGGVIDPEWSTWKFTPSRLQVDDFPTMEAYREFWKAHPDYYQITPRPERILE